MQYQQRESAKSHLTKSSSWIIFSHPKQDFEICDHLNLSTITTFDKLKAHILTILTQVIHHFANDKF